MTFAVVLNFGLYIPLSKYYHDLKNATEKSKPAVHHIHFTGCFSYSYYSTLLSGRTGFLPGQDLIQKPDRLQQLPHCYIAGIGGDGAQLHADQLFFQFGKN